MQDRPTLISQTPILSERSFINNQPKNDKHVLQPNRYSSSTQKRRDTLLPKPRCSLLSIPGESLTHITTYVDDPPSLLALSQVNRRLRDHVAEDNTWYRAFAFHFWGVGPESNPEDVKRLTLRRVESNWRREFVTRFNVSRRWKKSRSSTLIFQPHYWNVSSMHLLENISLMTSNLQYGIVSRSFPLTGKTLKGYLDASGTTNGLGIGNPNEEFSPNVSCIAMSSLGGTGRIAWGLRNGEVAITSAPRVMDSNRSAARYARCRVEDEHAGDVRCLLFAGREDELVVSGCSHGQVKLWDTKRMQCLWTGFAMKGDVGLPESCVKVEYCGAAHILVAALKSGDVMVWWGFQFQSDGTGAQLLVGSVQGLRVVLSDQPTLAASNAIDALYVDGDSSSSKVKILVHHATSRHFVQLVVDLSSALITTVRFCDGPLGPLTSINPCFVTQDLRSVSNQAVLNALVTSSPLPSSKRATDLILSREYSFVLAGDSLGRVCVWRWDAEGSFVAFDNHEQAPIHGDTMEQVGSSHRWEAHDDGEVCAIEVNKAVIVTGSSRGTLKVWDPITFAPLRSFASPASKPTITGQWDPVGQIIVRGDLLVASVGSRILVWQTGAVVPNKKGKAKHAGKPKGRSIGNTLHKWQQQVELNRDIRESQRLLDEERAHANRVHGRAREQFSTLDQLGLNEREAVDYLLMLSREEEDQRRASESASIATVSESAVDGGTSNDDIEGVFRFDGHSDVGQEQSVAQCHGSPIIAPSQKIFSPRSGPSCPAPRAASSNSNSEVRVSPLFLPEPNDVEFSDSRLRLSETGSSSVPMSTRQGSEASVSMPSTPISSLGDPKAFPAISSSSGMSCRSTSSLQLSGSWTRGSPSRSLSGAGSEGNTGPRPIDSISSPTSTSISWDSSFLAQGSRPEDVSRTREEELDEELRFVLELSLAEARSRGE